MLWEAMNLREKWVRYTHFMFISDFVPSYKNCINNKWEKDRILDKHEDRRFRRYKIHILFLWLLGWFLWKILKNRQLMIASLFLLIKKFEKKYVVIMEYSI